MRHAKFAILSFRPKCPAIAGFLFRAVARDYSFWVYIVTKHNHNRVNPRWMDIGDQMLGE